MVMATMDSLPLAKTLRFDATRCHATKNDVVEKFADLYAVAQKI